MSIIGTVKDIWRYPVKSMAGEKLARAQVMQTGIVGDRGWAMRNDAVREIKGGKKFPALMQGVVAQAGNIAVGDRRRTDVLAPTTNGRKPCKASRF